MALTKRLEIDDEVADVLRRSAIVPHPVAGGAWILKLPDQLARDLYERVNKLITAEGGDWKRGLKGHLFDRDPRETFAQALDAGELIIQKEGWFPTPPEVVEQMLDMAPWWGGDIGEFSAGEGAIAEGIVRRWPEAELYLLCVEKNAHRAEILRRKGLSVMEADFLTLELPPVFARAYINPPFEAGQDIEHVLRAYNMLARGGKLVSVMSEGVFYREDRKAKDFRSWIEDHAYRTWILSADAFKASGTNVRTRLVHLIKEG